MDYIVINSSPLRGAIEKILVLFEQENLWELIGGVNEVKQGNRCYLVDADMDEVKKYIHNGIHVFGPGRVPIGIYHFILAPGEPWWKNETPRYLANELHSIKNDAFRCGISKGAERAGRWIEKAGRQGFPLCDDGENMRWFQEARKEDANPTYTEFERRIASIEQKFRTQWGCEVV